MILRSNLFFDPSVRRRRVKSPVEFAVGTIRALEIVNPTVQAAALAEACGRMGQSLFAPPSVAGWDGGPRWINSTAMLARANLALGLLSDEDEALGRRCNPWALAGRHGRGRRESLAGFFIDLLAARRTRAQGPAADREGRHEQECHRSMPRPAKSCG